MARQRWLVAVLAVSTFTIACEKKKEAGKTDGKTAPGVAPDKGGGAAAGQTDLQLIPVDSEAVIGVNWSQLTGSPLWKQFVEPEMLKDGEFIKNMQMFKDRCGFDPMTAVKKMTVGVMVLHGLDKAKTLACADKWQEEAAKEKVTIKKDGDIVTFSSEDGGASMMFISDNRLLVVVGKTVGPEDVKKAAQGGSTLSTSAAFVDMHGKIMKDQSIWFLMNGSSKIFEGAAQLGLKPKAAFGSLNVTDVLSADVRARLDSPDQATQTVSSFKGQIQAMASMFDKIDLTSDGADVKLSAAASVQKLQNLAKFFDRGM
jgi:hypothetical protein